MTSRSPSSCSIIISANRTTRSRLSSRCTAGRSKTRRRRPGSSRSTTARATRIRSLRLRHSTITAKSREAIHSIFGLSSAGAEQGSYREYGALYPLIRFGRDPEKDIELGQFLLYYHKREKDKSFTTVFPLLLEHDRRSKRSSRCSSRFTTTVRTKSRS